MLLSTSWGAMGGLERKTSRGILGERAMTRGPWGARLEPARVLRLTPTKGTERQKVRREARLDILPLGWGAVKDWEGPAARVLCPGVPARGRARARTSLTTGTQTLPL